MYIYPHSGITRSSATSLRTVSSCPSNSSAGRTRTLLFPATCRTARSRRKRRCSDRAWRSNGRLQWNGIPGPEAGCTALPCVNRQTATSGQESFQSDSLLVDVIFDLLERPADQRVDLYQTPLVELDHFQPLPLGPLTPPPTGDDSLDTEFRVRPRGRLNFDQVVVTCLVRFPQLRTVLRGELFGRRDTRGGVGV